MASRPAIMGALRRLSGAFPRGGYSFGGDLKDEVVEAWEQVFSGEHITDAVLANAVNECLMAEKAPNLNAIHQAIMGHKRSGNRGEHERRELGCEDCNHSGVRQVYAVVRRQRPNSDALIDKWLTEVVRCTCALGQRMHGGTGPDVNRARDHYSKYLLAKGVQMPGCAWFALSKGYAMIDHRGHEVSHKTIARYRNEVLNRRPPECAPPKAVPMDLDEHATEDDQHMAHTYERLTQQLGLEGPELEQAMRAERERIRQRTLHRAGELS